LHRRKTQAATIKVAPGDEPVKHGNCSPGRDGYERFIRFTYRCVLAEVLKATDTQGHKGAEAVMRKYGWVPMNLQRKGNAPDKSTKQNPKDPGDISPLFVNQLSISNLSVHMYGFRNDRQPSQFAVYGQYSWNDCLDMAAQNKQGPMDVFAIDWNDTTLTLLDQATSNSSSSYRGEYPFQRSIVFNAHDPIRQSYYSPYCLHTSSTGWGVFNVPSGSTGKIFGFNMKFEHTYTTVSKTTEYGVSLEWDTALKGNASYTLKLQTEDRKLDPKGDYYSCTCLAAKSPGVKGGRDRCMGAKDRALSLPYLAM
jgi:hypothetical protein